MKISIKDYPSARQETLHDLQRMYPGTLLLTLRQAATVYGYKDTQKAKSAIGAPRVLGQRNVVYYIGDIASDIARKRCGNVSVKP